MSKYLDSLTQILNIGNTESGLKFVQQITKKISQQFELEGVFVAKLSADKEYMQTDSIYLNDQFINNVHYQFKSMPCSNVFNEKRICTFQANINSDVKFLNQDFHTYIGAPIFGHKGDAIGVLVGLSAKGISELEELKMIFNILSNRISVEYERMNNEFTLRQLNEKLESLVYDRNRELNKVSEELHHKDSLLEQRYQENLILIRLLCHDLVNPLSIISMCTEFLQDQENLDENNAKILDRINRSCSNMNKIINTVRELQSLLSGKKKFNKSSVSIDEIFDYTKSIFQDQLNDKSISLILEKDKNTSFFITVEKQSFINNVLSNLISNAIKFSEPGSIVTIKAHENDHELELTIKDQGIGMNDELIKNMFLYDKKANRPGTRGESGNGFGMPLVKLFLDLNNIKFKVESKAIENNPESHGTNFYLYIPKAA